MSLWYEQIGDLVQQEKSKKSSEKLQGQCPAEGKYWFQCQCDYFLKKMERAVCIKV